MGNTAPKIKCPTVFGKDAHCWRWLTAKEAGLCMDVPVMTSRTWTEAMHNILCKHLASPVKIASAIAQCIHHHLSHVPNLGDIRTRLTNNINDTMGTHQNKGGSKRPRFSDPETDMLSARFVVPRMAGYQSRTEQGKTAAESAVKHDNAAVPEHLWNDRVAFLSDIDDLETRHTSAFALLQTAMLRRWQSKVYQSWFAWWNRYQEVLCRNFGKEMAQLIHDRGEQACYYARHADFWTWTKGSAPFFWRWPEEFIKDLANGFPPLWTATPSQRIERQSSVGERQVVAMVKTKLQDVRMKGYVRTCPHTLATMNYFAVPKGENDVRMVYDGTKSGLNACLYAPWFYLPDSDGLTRTLNKNFWCIVNNYGEMFLNFWIHPDLQKYSGMDLTPLYGQRSDKSLWIESWTRCPMGQSPSPFVTIQQTQRLKRIVFRDPADKNNVFRWSYVLLNLPGSEGYQPGEPWIAKRRDDGRIAADAHDYVDDLRGTAPTMEDAWQVGSRIAKVALYHGIQDAARKRREQSTRPGAWAGVVCGTAPKHPYISITHFKWDRTKAEIARLRKELNTLDTPQSDHKIDHKTLEQVAGFLNHIARAFPTIRIFLNGIYGTMNAWRPDRDEDG
ncbi:hypothetical protein ACA910_009861 [Epithemia clementina (nom. ined.)]